MSISITLNGSNPCVTVDAEKFGIIILGDNKELVANVVANIEKIGKEAVKLRIISYSSLDSKLSKFQSEGIVTVTVCDCRSKFIKCVSYLGKKLFKKLRKNKFEIIPLESILKTDIAFEGLLTKCKPNDSDLLDIAHGIYISNMLSRLEIGNSLIVKDKKIVEIETETNGLNEIISAYKCLHLKRSNGVLVKLTKNSQSLHYPFISPSTIIAAASAKIRGIIVSANCSRLLNKPRILRLANKYNIFILGI